MPSRRELLGTAGVVLAGATAGCLDGIPFLGDEPIEFAASTSTVPQSVLAETGYQEHDRRDVVVERTYEVAGQTQDVVVTNRLVEYDKGIDLADVGTGEDRLRAAVFTVLTTPQVDVLGETFNPVADMDSADLASMVQDRYEGVDDLQEAGERTATVAGQSTTVGAFETRADLLDAGITVDLTLHIAEAVEAGDDLIVAVGGYPTLLRSQEESNVFAMLEAIEHDD